VQVGAILRRTSASRRPHSSLVARALNARGVVTARASGRRWGAYKSCEKAGIRRENAHYWTFEKTLAVNLAY